VVASLGHFGQGFFRARMSTDIFSQHRLKIVSPARKIAHQSATEVTSREVEMDTSIGRLRLFLAAGNVVALLPFGVAEAKDRLPWTPSKPSDESRPRYCVQNLVQKDLRGFERRCEVDHLGHPHCSVDTSCAAATMLGDVDASFHASLERP
jgi:hypothetical protein